MSPLWWLAAYLIAWWLSCLVAPEDTTLRTYISVFFMGGAARGIVSTLWREQDD